MNIFINLCKNSGIDCNKKKKKNDMYKNIIHNNKIHHLCNNIVHSNKYK